MSKSVNRSQMPDETNEKSTKLNWKSILVTSTAALIVSLLGSLLLSWWQAKEPKLLYSLVQPVPFPGEQEVIGTYQIEIENAGKTELENILLTVDVPDAQIKQDRIQASPSIERLSRWTNSTYYLSAPSINPKENLLISLLVSSPKALSQQPVISLRAKGIVGALKSESADSKSTAAKVLQVINYLLAGACAGMTATIVLLRSKKQLKTFGSRDDQRQVLASLCIQNGLDDIADIYLNQRSETTYWLEAEWLTTKAIKSKSKECLRQTRNILEAIKERKTLSKGSGYSVSIQIALLDWHLGNKDGALKSLAALKTQMVDDQFQPYRDRIVKIERGFEGQTKVVQK
jgi:hypothetical protein